MTRSTSTLVIERWHGEGPGAAAAALHGRPRLAWLDSSRSDARLGRWSIVASDPRWALTAYGADVLLETAGGPRRLGPGALHAFHRPSRLNRASRFPTARRRCHSSAARLACSASS